MANTYTIIASSTVGSGGASNIEFTSIPATYTDLLIKLSSRSSDTGTGLEINFNNDTGSNYKYQRFYAAGSITANFSTSATKILGAGLVGQYTYTANTFGNSDIYILNYASSVAKSVSYDGNAENNASTGWNTFNTGYWTSTDAITSIKLLAEGGNFAQHSTAYLYGIKNS